MPFIKTSHRVINTELSFFSYKSALVLPFSIISPDDDKLKEINPPYARYYITGGLYAKNGEKIAHSERIGGIGGDHALSLNPEFLKPLSSVEYPIIRGRSLYLGHWMGHYGHFITEFLSHLWCINSLPKIDQIVVLPFLFDGKKVVVKPWHKTLLHKLGLSHLEIVTLDKSCILEEVFVPEQGWILNHTVNSKARQVYNKISLTSTKNNSKGCYFLSRNQKGYSRLTNLAEIEAIFEKYNFNIIFPEKLSIDEQLDIYANAACLASASGTGLHNSIFAKDTTLIIELGDTRNSLKAAPMQRGATELLEQRHYFIPYHGTGSGALDMDILESELKALLIQERFFEGEIKMNLMKLAVKHKTDKWGSHFYTPHYERHLTYFKDKPVNILEIGIGGYNNPYGGGNSLRVWSEWFTHPESQIIGVDINNKLMNFDDPRVKIHKGSQVDVEFLEKIHQLYGDFDIIIDDGSHRPEHVIETFGYLYPKTKDGGVYVIEDTQTSYWNDDCWGAQATYNQNNPTYSYFKNIPDWINYAEIPIAKKPSFFELHTVGVHFYHNLIFIDKNINIEKSNVIPSRLDSERAEAYKAPILFSDNKNDLCLMVHIGGMGDITNSNFPSIKTEGKPPNYIQGYMLTSSNSTLSNALEYRARFDTGEWSEWVACNDFVGTRGMSRNLTGFTVRLNMGSHATLKVIGAFNDAHGLIVVGNGDDCVSKLGASLYGMQVILQST